MTRRILRPLAALVLAGVIALVVVLLVNRESDTHGYLVRAVFDNSSFVLPGEEVKVAGVPVGKIHAIDLTDDNRAAVVLEITNKRFEPFRTDAHCSIGLQSLLGEQYVQCTPTAPRAAGSAAPPALAQITSGGGKGQHLLPVANTTTPVGFDLLLNMNRLPQQQRFRLLIAGLGVGLQANGEGLNAALRRTDPALQKADRVIKVLADQNQTIARLTDESDRVLAPLAAQRAHLGGFVNHAGAVAAAAASESDAIQQNLADFPAFLRQLSPATQRLSRFADSAGPTLDALDQHAGAIDQTVSELKPFFDRARPAVKSLGPLADRGRRAFPDAEAVTRQLLALSKPLQPVAHNVAAVASSFDRTGGIEDVMRFIYYYTGAVNGEDSLGHYTRALLQISNCVQRAGIKDSTLGCDAQFDKLQITRGPFKGNAPAAAPATSASSAIVAQAVKSVDPAVNANSLSSLSRYLLGR